MMADDLTLEILKGIREDTRELRVEMHQGFADVRQELRQEIAGVRGELRGVTGEIASLRIGMQELRDEMISRDTAVQLRSATRIIELITSTRRLQSLAGQQELRQRIEQCEREIDELKKRS